MKQEMIDWFNNYFDNCYKVIHKNYPDSIFMYYDINYVRQQKIAKIEGKITEKENITGILLFEQNYKDNTLKCNYNFIWRHFTKYDIYTYNEIQSVLKELLKDRPRLNTLAPIFIFDFQTPKSDEYYKMSVFK